MASPSSHALNGYAGLAIAVSPRLVIGALAHRIAANRGRARPRKEGHLSGAICDLWLTPTPTPPLALAQTKRTGERLTRHSAEHVRPTSTEARRVPPGQRYLRA